MLSAIFQAHGYKTGLYTSPHLKDFRERIRINGEMISEQFVIDFTEKIIPYLSWMRFSVDASEGETYKKIHGVKPDELYKVFRKIWCVNFSIHILVDYLL
jgi:hypothetical protein